MDDTTTKALPWIAALLFGTVGCWPSNARLKHYSAGLIGCRPAEMVSGKVWFSDGDYGWTVACRGHEYVCSNHPGGVACSPLALEGEEPPRPSESEEK